MDRLIETFKKLDAFLDGRKQAAAALATALGATALIVHNVAAQGLHYLLTLPHSPEFAAAAGGWIAFFNALKGEKIRAQLNKWEGQLTVPRGGAVVEITRFPPLNNPPTTSPTAMPSVVVPPVPSGTVANIGD